MDQTTKKNQKKPEVEKPYKCSKCLFTTQYKSVMKSHIDGVHYKKKPFRCSVCNFSAAKTYTLKKHMENLHEKEVKFNCPMCPFFTEVKTNLTAHIAFQHKNLDLEFCQYCDYFCAAQKNRMKDHIRSVHERIRLYKCSICGKGFETSRNMNRHMESKNVHKYIKVIY